MRIVGGRLGGRRFAQAVSTATRPTSDRVREALGSVLDARNAIVDARVLDLFAGTGAMAFECLSRGAREAVLVDHDRKAVAAIRRDARDLGLGSQLRVVDVDLLGAPATVVRRLSSALGPLEVPFGLILADPPYSEAAHVPPLFAALRSAELADDRTLFVLEHATRSTLATESFLASVGQYRYGDTTVELFRSSAEGRDGP